MKLQMMPYGSSDEVNDEAMSFINADNELRVSAAMCR